MLLGIFVKNFKCYQGRHFIPCFSVDGSNNFVSYLGDNGVGKSAVLEALDVFFSRKPKWHRNKDSKKGASECFVAPVFMIDEKDQYDEISIFSESLIKNINVNRGVNVPKSRALLSVVKREDGFISFYDGKKEIDENEAQKEAEKVYNNLLKKYQYIYIDAEVDIDEQARINSDVYELIAGSSIVVEVEKKFKETEEKQKLAENLNKTLKLLVDEKLTRELKQVDKKYSYDGSQGAVSKLTTNLLARVTTEAFLASRKLKYDGKHIDNLSSGQRRRSLLDFIIAILKNKIVDKSKTVILAIDEPEISLDSGVKMAQFDKLLNIADKEVCVMITSHWYGWIPSTNIGRSVLISEEDNREKEIAIFENKDFPFRDMPKYEMRMIFDFLVSLGANAEANRSMRYVICEGESDVIYLRASLKNNNYKIIPVGKGRVKRIADIFKNYFWKNNGPTLKNILFLIDTDPEHGDSFDGNTYLKRWAKDSELNISLVSGNENIHSKCTIEDVLEPVQFLESLKKIHRDSTLIVNLNIKYPDHFGSDSFGLDAISNREFYKETKDKKIELATNYAERLGSVTTTKIGNLIDAVFL